LADAQDRVANLHKKGRHDTPKGEALQRQITDFERLVELRDLMVERHASEPDINVPIL
jgi:hypothetical protein